MIVPVAVSTEESTKLSSPEAMGLSEFGANTRTVGGGSLPDETLPSRLVAIGVESEAALAARLRAAEPPVVARLDRDRLLLDPRTILPEDDDALLDALRAALQPVDAAC